MDVRKLVQEFIANARTDPEQYVILPLLITVLIVLAIAELVGVQQSNIFYAVVLFTLSALVFDRLSSRRSREELRTNLDRVSIDAAKLDTVRNQLEQASINAGYQAARLNSVINELQQANSNVDEITSRINVLNEEVQRVSDSVAALLDRVTPPVRFFPSQTPGYITDICLRAATSQVKDADLLEYSSWTILTNLLDELVSQHFTIRLLVAHPSNTINKYQKDRIMTSLEDLRKARGRYGSATDKFQIRCYRQIAALRGRRIGDELISVGWYTYRPEPLPPRDPQDITGHDNPVITADLHGEAGAVLQTMFYRVFNELWESAVTLDEVLQGKE